MTTLLQAIYLILIYVIDLKRIFKIISRGLLQIVTCYSNSMLV